ncbi:DUF1269 domain-containing protein [Cryptosporangium aurantiacum]|uniref:Uncharacterized membrane protein n=1 Tax=Cryptosporangium aurantiacum TaxID=134849 RepID=A0A1M7RG04_9ACTN|nr:DUF1269 domain-containing protein [Cryptosporangium aurantiacum]SHN45136.1 Uncharacterized membrane protein [Cryptosporangium aurantiacum]
MTTFTVWKFDDPKGAEQIERVVQGAALDGLVTVVDHAVVSWPYGAARPETHHKHDSSRHAAGWGALWGLLIGTLFLVPLVGGAVGAAIGAISKATEGTGITRDDLERIRTQITEGSSALFLVTDEANLDRLGERFHGMHSTLVATNLTEGEREILLETFGDHRP